VVTVPIRTPQLDAKRAAAAAHAEGTLQCALTCIGSGPKRLAPSRGSTLQAESLRHTAKTKTGHTVSQL
jgi:hypothetical protein